MKALPKKLSKWQRALDAAQVAFEAECAQAVSVGGDRGLAVFLNAFFRCWLTIAAANEDLGVGITTAEVRAIAVKSWPMREVDEAEDRALYTSIAYRLGFKLRTAGAKDGRIEAAMQFAAAMEGMTHDGASETIRKSISRLRNRLRGTSVFRLDPETLCVSVLDAESALIPALPGRAGRPKG